MVSELKDVSQKADSKIQNKRYKSSKSNSHKAVSRSENKKDAMKVSYKGYYKIEI